MTVYLVGAGPGDPGLLTVRGAALLARATTVVHDRLVAPGVLALAGEAARILDVGKRGDGGPSASQDDINALLVEAGRREAVVVRLKGGDPFLFGRGGEEALALEAAGVAYEVVPGVSAALAAAAAAGVPVTHRGAASAVAVLSGHGLDEAPAEAAADDWAMLGASSATLVVLMGASTSGRVAERLLAAGRPGDTPVVVVERATTTSQSTARTTLGGLAALEVASPATIVVGPVAGLRLASYEDRLLAGRRVVVTREAGRSGPLAERLTGAGAEVVELPTRATAPPADGGEALRRAAGRLGEASWVVLGSATAVEALFGVLHDARDLAGVRVAAAGPATAAALRGRGVAADLVAAPGSGRGAAAALVAAFPPGPGDGSGLVVVPRSASGRDEMVEGLRRLGWAVEAVEAYRSVVPPADPGAVERLRGADAVVLASPSAVDGLLALAGAAGVPKLVVTIGPTTTAAARERGLEVAAEAASPDPEGIVAALEAAAGRRRS